MRGVKLGQNLNLLLNILYLIFCTLEVDNLNSHSLLCSFIIADVLSMVEDTDQHVKNCAPFIDLSKGSFACGTVHTESAQ